MKKVLTASEMGAIDRETVALGIPGEILMENAGCRVVEFLERRYSPLDAHRIVILCGKGNNGGDGLVIARQIYSRFQPKSLHVVLTAEPLAERLRMLEASGCPVVREWKPEMAAASLVIDALLGTGLKGAATGSALEWIRRVNAGFPVAQVVAVDIPSGLPEGEHARADATVTFTALKHAHALPPACDWMGEITIAPIGTPARLLASFPLAVSDPADFAHLFAPRARDANKGSFGHVLMVAGSAGHTGAAAMAGLAALRSGAGLVTVASGPAEQPLVAAHTPELMTQPFPPDLTRKTVLAMGPGLGSAAETRAMVRDLFAAAAMPMVVDADGLNALSGTEWSGSGRYCVLTPHPGEMARLTGLSIAEIQADRLRAAQKLAETRQAIIVLKGQRTVIAFPDGRTFINPTGTPGMATGGTGDILTGLIAGLLAQHPTEADLAVLAAVYLHGLAGELAVAALTEQCMVATDILTYLPHAIRHIL